VSCVGDHMRRERTRMTHRSRMNDAQSVRRSSLTDDRLHISQLRSDKLARPALLLPSWEAVHFEPNVFSLLPTVMCTSMTHQTCLARITLVAGALAWQSSSAVAGPSDAAPPLHCCVLDRKETAMKQTFTGRAGMKGTVPNLPYTNASELLGCLIHKQRALYRNAPVHSG
jgi:hypothetical protein